MARPSKKLFFCFCFFCYLFFSVFFFQVYYNFLLLFCFLLVCFVWLGRYCEKEKKIGNWMIKQNRANL